MAKDQENVLVDEGWAYLEADCRARGLLEEEAPLDLFGWLRLVFPGASVAQLKTIERAMNLCSVGNTVRVSWQTPGASVDASTRARVALHSMRASRLVGIHPHLSVLEKRLALPP